MLSHRMAANNGLVRGVAGGARPRVLVLERRDPRGRLVTEDLSGFRFLSMRSWWAVAGKSDRSWTASLRYASALKTRLFCSLTPRRTRTCGSNPNALPPDARFSRKDDQADPLERLRRPPGASGGRCAPTRRRLPLHSPLTADYFA